MALLRSGPDTRDWENYRLDDYEEKKKAYLRTAAEEADQILKSARQKAGDILREAHAKGLEQAQSEAVRIKEEAVKKGYQDGLEKGREEALSLEKTRIEEDLKPVVEHFDAALKELTLKKDELLNSAEQTLVSTSIDLAKHVIEVESSFNAEILNMRLKKALNFLKTDFELKVRLPEGAREKCEPMLQQLMALEGRQLEIEWTEDPQFEPGSLVVSCGDSSVQFNNEIQWRSLLEKLKLKEEGA